MLAIIIGWQTTANALPVRVLRVMLISDVFVRVRGMLLTIQALAVRRLRLHGARGLFRSRRRRRLRTRGTRLEHSGILDVGLGQVVAGAVWRPIVLVLRVGIIVRQWRRVTLLGTLTPIGLCLIAGLSPRRNLLRRLSVSGR